MDTHDEGATLKQAVAQAGEATFWLDLIEHAGKDQRRWRDRAEKIVRRYRDEDEDDTGQRFNILQANMELLRPSVYARTPVPDVRRRHVQDSGEQAQVGKAMAEVLERSLIFMLDDTDFDEQAYLIRDDMLLVGMGVGREIYEFDTVDLPVQAETLDPATGEVAYFMDGVPVEPEIGDDGAPYVRRRANERVVTQHWFWADVRWSPARKWSEVWWFAFRHPMTRDELRDHFGEAAGGVPMTIDGKDAELEGKGEGDGPKDPAARFSRAEVWEVWNKRDRTRIWVATGHKQVLRDDGDPLNLKDFWPMPQPLFGLRTSDTLNPLPEFAMYQDQASELDELQARIRSFVKAIKAVAMIDGDLIEANAVQNAQDGELIPIARPGAAAEDLAKRIAHWPVGEYVRAIFELTQRSEVVKRQIYELTGLSDLSRGQTRASETFGAQRLKSQYGERRIQPRSEPMQRWVRDSLRIKAEIMAEMFEIETLEQICGRPIDFEVFQMMRDEKLRNTSISVATDSMLRPDLEQEKAEAVEFLTAVTQYLTAAVQIGAAQPALVPLLAAMLKAASRPFKFGRTFEDTLDEVTDQLTASATAPQPGLVPPGAGVPQNGTGEAPPDGPYSGGLGGLFQ